MSLIQGRKRSDYDWGWHFFRMGEGLPACAPRNMVHGYNAARKNALAYNEAAFKQAKMLAEHGLKPAWMDEIAARISQLPAKQSYWDQGNSAALKQAAIESRQARLDRHFAGLYARATHRATSQEASERV